MVNEDTQFGDVDITLLVPSYKGEVFIRKCLESIVAQTFDRSRFEVRVVVNGEPDGAVQIAHEVLGAADSLQYEVMLEEFASLSNARNVAIDAARGSWITWVDVDDWLSPNFLEALASSARSGVVPIATVIDVVDTTGEEVLSPIAQQVDEFAPGMHSAVDLWRPLTFAACKLLPTELARQHHFDVELRNGEDVAYFSPFFSKFGLQMDNSPAHAGASYYRLVREGSMSRLKPNFQFSILDRIAVMKHLDDAIPSASPRMGKLMRSLINAQGMFASRFLAEEPDQLQHVVRAFENSGLDYIPWHTIKVPSDRLLISYNYPPFADASAITAAKRAYMSGYQWNVVSQDMSKVRRRDPQLTSITGPSTSLHETIPGAPAFGSWRAMAEFCKDGLTAIERISIKQGPQRYVYSRAMWPASHFLAALHKKASEHHVYWSAEFSDPLRTDVLGRNRVGPVLEDSFFKELKKHLLDSEFGLPPVESTFAWSEWLAFCFADEIVFTNPLQRETMLAGIGDVRVVQRVRERSTVTPHPTLSSRFYDQEPVELNLDPSRAHVGYFGTFYANRGMGDALRALTLMSNVERNSILFHIFSDDAATILEQTKRLGVSNCVEVHGQLPYLQHLNAAKQMSALLVVDADTHSDGHRLNPYLPSKLSDYLGSGKPIMALYEPGSMLSRHQSRYSAPLHDIEATATALARLRMDVIS